jgi:hypothetical protein
MNGGLETHLPSPALSQLIRHYVITPRGPGGGGVFVPYAGCILSFLNRSPLAVGDGLKSRVEFSEPTVFGPLAEPVEYERLGAAAVRDITVVFTGLGAARLLGVPMDRLTGGIVEASSVLPNARLHRLTETLLDAPTIPWAIQHLNRFFEFRLMFKSYPVPEDFAAMVRAVENVLASP